MRARSKGRGRADRRHSRLEGSSGHKRVYLQQGRALRPARISRGARALSDAASWPKGEGRFERITWEEAIATIVARFREHHRAAWGRSHSPVSLRRARTDLTDGFLDDYFFARLGASRLARTLCAPLRQRKWRMGMYGKMPGVAFEDYVHSKCIVVWGANPKASNIHLVPFLRQAKRNGAFLAVVDPKQNFSSDRSGSAFAGLPRRRFAGGAGQ